MSQRRDRVVLHPVHGPGLAEAIREIPGIELVEAADADGVVSAIADGVEVLLTYPWDDRFLTGSLKWVQAISAGIDQFPRPALDRAGVVLTSARGAHTPAVAEHAIALLMAIVRGLGPAIRDAADRTWTPRRPAHEVRGLTLGVLGLGSIGEEVATIATALGMTVIGTKRSPEGYAGVARRVVGPDQTLAICQEADAVIVTLPHSDAPVVGPAELAALRDGWIVNVGRGSAIDEEALIEALADGTLRGAGLDVFTTEPLPADSPLWDLPTAVITPHAAWSTDRLAPRIAEVFATNLEAFRGEAAWATRVG
jgi:phosphoglycerate dehydrogenase-like enzyme